MKSYLYLFLILILSVRIITAEKIADFQNHTIPESVLINKDHIIITEGSTVFIYNSTNHKLIKRFGKRGEGPEEFKGSPIVFIEKNYLLINSPEKVSFYSKTGKYIKEINNINSGKLFRSICDNFIGYKSFNDKAGNRYSAINIYNPDFIKIKEVYKYLSIAQPQKGKGWRLFAKTYVVPIVCDNKIFTAGDEKFIINAFDKNGKKLFTIDRNYTRVKFTEENRNAILHLYKTRPSTAPEYSFWKKNIIFPKYFPAIRAIYTAEKKLFIRTYKIEKNRSEFFIYDSNGKIIKHVFLPIAASYKKNAYPYMRDFSPFTFYKGKLYQLIMDEETEKISLFAHDI